MAKNIILRPTTSNDIDGRIARIINDIGNPQPPLNLAFVFELLRLDRGYYTADSPSVLRKLFSRVRVGTLQILERPALLAEVVKKFDLRALYVPDEKRILIDREQPLPKHRWLEAHEIGHALLPWHKDSMFGDTAQTVTLACHEAIEAEANYAAGRLLFLRDIFTNEARDHVPSMAATRSLQGRFGNSLTTTLWRCVETWGDQRPIFGILSSHPHPRFRQSNFDPSNPCRHLIQSRAFARQFSSLSEVDMFGHIAGYCTAQRGGPLGSSEIVLCDDAGDDHLFAFETFSNTHDALTLGVHQGPVPALVGRL